MGFNLCKIPDHTVHPKIRRNSYHLLHRLPHPKQTRDHRHRIRPCLNHTPSILPRNPTNRHNRLPRQRPSPPHPLQPHHRLRIHLSPRSKHRPNSHIIRTPRVRHPNLLLRMRRNPHNPGTQSSGAPSFAHCEGWDVNPQSPRPPSEHPPATNPPAPHAPHQTQPAQPNPPGHS